MRMRTLVVLMACGISWAAQAVDSPVEAYARAIAAGREGLMLERERNIARLDAYARRGVFPRNLDYPKAPTPYFVDASGTACAVGQLMLSSGWSGEVEAIERTNNHVYIRSVHEGRLLDWIAQSGLTQDECAAIQPTYDFNSEAKQETKRLKEHFASREQELYRDFLKSLDKIVSEKFEKDAQGLPPKNFLDDPKSAEQFSKVFETHADPTVRLGAMIALLHDEDRPGTAPPKPLSGNFKELGVWRKAAEKEQVRLVTRGLADADPLVQLLAAYYAFRMLSKQADLRAQALNACATALGSKQDKQRYQALLVLLAISEDLESVEVRGTSNEFEKSSAALLSLVVQIDSLAKHSNGEAEKGALKALASWQPWKTLLPLADAIKVQPANQ